jgi:hypothetical protein
MTYLKEEKWYYHLKLGMNKLRKKFGKDQLNQIKIIRRKIKR